MDPSLANAAIAELELDASAALWDYILRIRKAWDVNVIDRNA